MQSITRPRMWAAVLAGALAVVLTSCGSAGGSTESAEATDVNFSLEYTPTGYHAPYALALEKGWFADAGLNVRMTPGTGSSATITTVAGGRADIGLTDLATLVITKEKGMSIKAFGVMFAKSPTAVAVHKDLGVESPADLDGMSIAVTTGGLDAQLLPAFLASNGLTGKVKVVNVSSSAKTGAFLARKVNGFVPLLCGTGVVVEQQEHAPLTALPFSDYGVDIMGLGMVSNEKFMSEHPDALKAFLKVSDQAWTYAQEHPDEAVEAMTSKFPEVKAETAKAQLNCAFDFIKRDDNKDAPFGTMSADGWDSMIAILKKYAGVTPLSGEEYYTTKFELE